VAERFSWERLVVWRVKALRHGDRRSILLPQMFSSSLEIVLTVINNVRRCQLSWTKEDLQQLVTTKLAGRLFIVVSNREPYIHNLSGDEIQCIVPASGLTVALDPVMRACGCAWVAHGSGSADREVVDEKSRVLVPPDEPRYTLRRVWLTKEEEEG
jgi:hypothetical protein